MVRVRVSFRVRVRFRFGFGNLIGGAVGTVGYSLGRRLCAVRQYISGNGEVVMKVLEVGKLNTFQRF